MAHIYRLIFCCLVVLMAWLPASSFALIPTYSGLSVTSGYPGSFSSYVAAADGFLPIWVKSYTGNDPAYCTSTSWVFNVGNKTEPPAGTTSYPVQLLCNGAGQGLTLYGSVQQMCPANSVASGSACACVSGFSENSAKTACVPTPALCDWAKGQTQMIFGTFQIERGKELCSSGCGFTLKADAGMSPESSRLNGTSPWMDTRTMGDFSGTGSVCASSTTGATTGTSTPSPYPPGEDGTPPKDTCPTGKIGGTVNGAFICVTPGETVTAKKAETTNNDGTDTKKDTVQKSTNCVGATCTTTTNTTTTTTNNSSGTVTTSTAAKTEVQTKGDYCKSNATDKACLGVGSGSFSGTCGAAPACSGDAVMCAVAAATFATNCKVTEALTPDDAATARATAALNGSDGVNTDSMKAAAHGSAVAISNFDVTGKGWSRSCPADPVIAIPWGSISSWTLPLSRICSPLQILANAAVGITLLASLVWVIGGRKT